MTDKEKAIVMAYTGIAMLTGDKFEIFHKYVEEIMHRPVFTHEFAMCAEEIKERSKPDFLKLCHEELKTETKKCPNCGNNLYEYCFMCCYEGEKVSE